MAMLYDANYLSASQLASLGWGEYLGRAGERRLKRLHDDGYVDRFRPLRAAGRAQWNYRLSEHGFGALAKHDVTSACHTYTPAALASISYAEHDLQLAALVIHIAQEATRERTGGLMDRMPFTWKGPSHRTDRGRLPRPVERSPAVVLPARHHAIRPRSRRGYLEPDATLIGGSGKDLWAVLIEYDRTDRPHKRIDRLRRYDHWMLDGWRHSRFASHAIPPTVIFLTSRERPLQRLIETADKTFSAWYGHEDAGPREGTHPAREWRGVHKPRARFRRRLGRAQDPEPAAGTRKQPAVCSPHSVDYNLPTLFASSEGYRRVCMTPCQSDSAGAAIEAAAAHEVMVRSLKISDGRPLR